VIVLHALWDICGKLHLWAESSTPADTAPRRGKRPSKKSDSHPFALSPDSLGELIAAISGDLTGGDIRPEAITALLPSTRERPLPSRELLRFGDSGIPETGATREISLAPWRIATLSMAADVALDFLLCLPDRPPHGAIFGSSLRFWAEAAKLSIELIARQCFLPTLKEEGLEGSRQFKAAWEAVIEGTDLERLHLLARAMPPCCRAIAYPGKKPLLPEFLVRSFLDQTMDSFIRKSLETSAAGGPPRSGSKGRKSPSLAGQWLEALSSQAPYLTAPARDLASFSKEMKSWLSQVQPLASDTALFTCLRLDSPDNGNQEWNLSFHLQAREDRSLLIPAEKVWQAKSGIITFLKHRFENPQERLLADLGKASRIFPPVEESLKTACPVEVNLDTKDAYEFLRHAAPVLERSGFGILLPNWWHKPAASPGMRLKLKPEDKTKKLGSGLLGMDAIISYEWEIALGGAVLKAEEFEKLAMLKVPLVRVRGQWVELKPEEVEKAIAFFKKRGIHGEMRLGEAVRAGLGREISESGLPVADVTAEGWIGDFLDTWRGDASRMPLIAPSKDFNGQLRPYQVAGVSWMAFLRRFGFGACLADDMGLGKTIEFLALLLNLRDNRLLHGPSLLICPMSVVNNWKREAERFTPSLKVMVHHGPGRASGKAFVKQAKTHDLVITTYALAHRDAGLLSGIKWECISLDEGQNIKNPSARQTQAVRKLNGNFRVALTGTPVENRLSELWSIMEFLNPGYLGTAGDFRSKFVIPVEKFRSPTHAERLKTLIQPFVLRRVKTDPTIISDLPEKIETKVFCHLTREQATLYQAVVKEMMEKIESSEGIERKGLVLATLMKLKQVCNHPAHFLQDGSVLEGRSGKLLRLEEMLEEILAEGDRALIFTQFAEMGQMLRRHLQEALACETIFLHGGTSRKERDAMVQRFQGDHRGPSLFILSLKAGGLGLNLTAANHVFHFDRWWNPAVENQATDRAFRIGQKRNVQVHKFVCSGTLEERIDQMIEQKKELAGSIVGAGEAWLTGMSTRQLREVLTLSREAVES